MDAPETRTDEATSPDVCAEEERGLILEQLYYSREDLSSRPVVSEDSHIPLHLLRLAHSFGYDCERRANLQLLDEHTLLFIAGNLLLLLDTRSGAQTFIRSSGGGGIGAITTHPSRQYFAVAEKGHRPNIIVYEYPSLRPYRILRGGTASEYSCVAFSADGSLLASVGSHPDYMLTLWDWRQEQAALSKKAFSQDVFRVAFSSESSGTLTTAGSGHIRFWKMANTFTGLKLQGLLGSFGKTTVTDIEGFVELPDGKVVSGSDWGNLLLWEGGLVKVELSRGAGRSCHSGAVTHFSLDEGELISAGADGAVRSWNLETIDVADAEDESGLFEIQPMNEIIVGRNVSLKSMVKSPESSIWFAQDSNGCIWKLDLSFSNITQDPQCLFTFHAGGIQGMDVSDSSHLMATTASDASVRVFDFLSNKELTVSRFRQGGTALTWASDAVSGSALLLVGFSDGVVRLLELYDPQSLDAVAGRRRCGDADLRLRQALKPHDATVTALACDRSGRLLATGSADGTVFFFTVGQQYRPVGFVQVPGPVKGLQWAPPAHEENTLLVFCVSGHVVQLQCPDPETQSGGNTFQLAGLPTLHFCFSSIKSRIKRDAALALRRARDEQKQREREERRRRMKEERPEAREEELQEEEEEEEEEEELPPLYSPSPPSPLHCGFYTAPRAFCLSMGGFDSGYLYLCEFSEEQRSDPAERRDEPLSFIPVSGADQNAIVSVRFSSSGRLLLCGMEDGSLRVYPVQPWDLTLGSMGPFWALSVHDNQYGSVRHVRFSFDDAFVLSAGDDGNIFSFSCLPQEQIQAQHATVPAPRAGLETERAAQDIEDPSAYSIETAMQKLELERVRAEADGRKQERRRRLEELRTRFQALLKENQSLPEHVRLHRSEFELDPRFPSQLEQQTEERVMEARRELAWDEERLRVGLSKLHRMFWESAAQDCVCVFAFESEHQISTYRLSAPPAQPLLQQNGPNSQSGAAEHTHTRSTEPDKHTSSSSLQEESPTDPLTRSGHTPSGSRRLTSREAEKLRKAAEKAERARATIERRRRDWAQLYASKPSEDYEDPRDVEAIRLAQEHMGDFKLKSAKDFTVPEQLRMNVGKKRAQLLQLEKKVFEMKSEMNVRVTALRDQKLQVLKHVGSLTEQLQAVQLQLQEEQRRPHPPAPALRPEETPERRHRYTRATLERYARLRAQGEGPRDVLELLEAQDTHTQDTHAQDTHAQDTHAQDTHVQDEALEPQEETQLEEEMREEQEIRNLFLQDTLLQQVEQALWRFDAELRVLRQEKQQLDVWMKLADLRHVTLLEELLLLKEFEKREERLQERLGACLQEEQDIRARTQDCRRQMELKRRDVLRLQAKEKSIAADFQSALGESHRMEELLTRVFRRKVKRVKKKETHAAEGGDVTEDEEDSDEDSDEESDGDNDEDDEESETGAPLDDSVCPPNCDPELFENTLRLREQRLDVEEQLQEDIRTLDALKKECDTLTKKEKTVQSSRRAAEGDLELINREKQQRLNEVDVVLPLRLHQVELGSGGALDLELEAALLLNTADLQKLHTRIQELQREKTEQKELDRSARQQHVQLRHELRDMESRIRDSEVRCEQLMLMKFGKLVELEVLQTLSGSRKVEEMRHDIRERDGKYTQELKRWEASVAEGRETLTAVTQQNTQRLQRLNELLRRRTALDQQLNARQRTTVGQFSGRAVEQQDLQRLQRLASAQAQDIAALNGEIRALSRKDGRVLPPLETTTETPQRHAGDHTTVR